MLEAMNRCIIMHIDEKHIMTVPQLATLLGITETAVKKRIKSGSLIASKMGTGQWKVYPQLEWEI
jgi:predicted transcriptional regulator